jgi:4,5-DOPA dioxygenase extradiol
MPISSLFLSHGAPTIALEDGGYAKGLGRFGRALPAPSALVVFSGHFQSSPPLPVTSGTRPSLVYDFSGFPAELYRLTYPAPGEPPLAKEIGSLLERQGFAATLDARRGWDHGVWIPLRLLFPKADVPVIEVALPRSAPPAQLMRIGEALSPLRDRGVLLVGSGGIVHNLARVRFGDEDVDPWAREFDEWVAERLAAGAVGDLLDYRAKAPHAELAVPTSEHFDPLFVALGYAAPGGLVTPIYQGFQHGNISLRSLALG